MNNEEISDLFPYQSKYIEVKNAKIHYIDEGTGEPMLFLHGVPTWSYLWRNVIAQLTPKARCIAPDLVGFGRSSHPDIQYTIFEHIEYINDFIKKLDLQHVTLVLHGWGSVIGLHYAMAFEENIKGIVFLESQIRPVIDKNLMPLPLQELKALAADPEHGYELVVNSTYYVDKILPASVMRKLTDNEIEAYRQPFSEAKNRLPLWQYIKELPLSGHKTPILDLIANYSEKLTHSTIPKLMFYAVPGFATSISTVQWAKDNLPNLTLLEIEDALHYPQESKPVELAQGISTWYESLAS